MQAALTHKNNWLFFGFAALLVIAAAGAVFWQYYYLLLVPFCILFFWVILQKLEVVFYLLIAAIPWSVEFNFNQTLGTDLPDEPLMLLTAFVVVIWMIQHYTSVLKKPVLHPILFLLALQYIWMLVAVSFSTNVIVSIKYMMAKSWYLLAFVSAPLILFQNTKHLKKTFALLLYSMLATVFIVLIRHAVAGFTFHTINPSLQPFFRNHVNYSALLVCMVPLLLAAIKLSAYQKNKIVFTCLLIMILFALYTSYARGAWLALCTGLLSYWLIQKRLLVTTFVLFIIASLGFVFWLQHNDTYLQFAPDFKTTIFHSDFSEHMIATYQMKDVSNAERFYRWVAGARMVDAKWQTGFGPTAFYENYKSYGLPAFKTWVSNNPEHSTVHNYFLLTIIEQGVMGLVLLLLLIGYLFYTAQQIYHRTNDAFWKVTAGTIAAILTMVCTVNFLSDLIETDKVGSVFYLCVATLIVADVKTRKL